MSDDTVVAKKIEYTPPAASWRLPVFIEASLEEIRAKQVSCSNCPVFFQCDAGEGGTGWVCGACNATGVVVTPIEEGRLPDHLLIIDCAKHKFERHAKSADLNTCSLCSGNQMELEIAAREAQQHYVATIHAKVPVEDRRKLLRDKYDFWKAQYAAPKSSAQ